jgi:hypothetical protein
MHGCHDSAPKIIVRHGRVDAHPAASDPQADRIRTLCSATGPHATQFRPKSGA